MGKNEIKWKFSKKQTVESSVVDPNTLNLDPDPAFCYSIKLGKKEKKKKIQINIIPFASILSYSIFTYMSGSGSTTVVVRQENQWKAQGCWPEKYWYTYCKFVLQRGG